jgi:hypothetical protein
VLPLHQQRLGPSLVIRVHRVKIGYPLGRDKACALRQLTPTCGHSARCYLASMHPFPHAALAVAAALTIATPSEACRVYRPPAQRVADGYKTRTVSAVTLVKVLDANYTRLPISDAHPWSASAKIVQVLHGSYSRQMVHFERGWGSAACDDGLPPPAVGELWVVYFWKRAEGDQPVWVSYPAKVAFAADPSLAKNVR